MINTLEITNVFLNAFLLIFLLLLPTAEVNADIYTKEYIYLAGDSDSKITSKSFAISQLKKELLEEIGTHIRATSITHKNSSGLNFFQQDIEAIVAGTLKLKILSESWDGRQYYIKANIETNPKEVLEELDGINKTVTHELSNINENNPDSLECKTKFPTTDAETFYNKAKAFKGTSEHWSNINTIKFNYRCAAYLGHLAAQYKMYMYGSSGNNTAYDKLNRMSWLSSSAKGGYPAAQYRMGQRYYGSKNQSTKMYWMYKAALSGYQEAMFEIGRAYYDGSYFNKDLLEAEKWLTKSVAERSDMIFRNESIALMILEEIYLSKEKNELRN